MIEPRCTAEAAHVSEVYSALQGEGTNVGERQVFLRFLECHIRCPYCDTPDQDPLKVTPRLERTAGLRDWEAVQNPVARERLLDAVLRLQTHPSLHRWVVFTGGEPLWYHPMIAALAPALREAGLRCYLETDGLLPDALAAVAHCVDRVAMDIKLHWTNQGFLDRAPTLRFLEVVREQQLELVQKMVIPAGVRHEPVLAVVAEIAADAPLILQPVTPYGPVTEAPSPAEMLALHEAVSRVHPDCRVVPQVHKLIGQR